MAFTTWHVHEWQILQPDVKKTYQIPGGKIEIRIVSGVSIPVLFFMIIFGFILPQYVNSKSSWAIIECIVFQLVDVASFLASIKANHVGK